MTNYALYVNGICVIPSASMKQIADYLLANSVSGKDVEIKPVKKVEVTNE